MGVVDNMGSGARGFKFEKVGDTVEGVVTDIRAQQDQDFATKALVTWPDGRPKMVAIFTLQTSLTDGTEEDDGIREVWARGNIHTAISDALRAAFKPGKPSDEAVMGGTLKVRFNATAPSSKGSPRKLYIAKFVRGSVIETAVQHDDANPPPTDW